MKRLIQHLVRTNFPEICAKSLLHSILLLACPEKTIRLFVAKPGHELGQNRPGQPLSVGFHSHHCELTLCPIFGSVTNWIIAPSNCGDLELWEHKYTSAITTGEPSFGRRSKSNFRTVSRERIPSSDNCYMHADAIHTIHVPEDESAAWLVFEGREDPLYTSLVYSNIDLSTFDFSGLYQKPTGSEILKLLHDCDAL